MMRHSRSIFINIQRRFSSTIIKEATTPLSRHLIDNIKMTGPMSVAQYMKHALIHPLGGYYMNKDVFGKEGDFTTSPEISQIFGELVALWFLIHYRNNAIKSKIRIVETGPGRGTLMADILRTLSQYNDIKESIESVHLIDASPHLRSLQQKNLLTNKSITKDDNAIESSTREDGIKLVWNDDLDQVPTGLPLFVVAHEFIDALPVFKFEYTQSGWREILIDINEMDDTPYNFRFVLSKNPTEASVALTKDSRYDASKIVGKRIEISPDAWGFTRKLGERIARDKGGAGLIIDYGKDGIIEDSLRGIRKHEFVDVLSNPGANDITCDVDFSFLKNAADGIVPTHGPITQARFLQSLGIGNRLKQLLPLIKTREQGKNLVKGVERLVDTGDKGMGGVYKVLAIVEGDKIPYSFQK